MQIPDYAVFRVGHLVDLDNEYLRLFGAYDKQELHGGVLVSMPSALCWPPPAWFSWDWKRLLTEEEYQALSFPPGWQTELYRGVVMAWLVAEAEAFPTEMDQLCEQARQWIDRHVPTSLEDG